MHASLLTWVYLNMQKQHFTLQDQCSRVKMLQMGACFVWKENPGGSNPSFMNVGPGISADIGARIILAPSFGISLEDMKTKIKGKVPQPAYQSNLFGPPAGWQGLWGYILFDLMQIEYILLSWTQEIMMKRIPYCFLEDAPKISQDPSSWEFAAASFCPWLTHKKLGCDMMWPNW